MNMWDAEVAIVGGGLAATSLARCCARDGFDVCLLSDSRLGSAGATGASRGILRLYDPDPDLMAWNVRGLAAWAALERDEGIPVERCGLLYFLDGEASAQVPQRMIRLGLDSGDIEILTPAQAAQRFPALRAPSGPATDGAVLFEPGSGYCNPQRAAQTLGDAALRLGARVLEGTSVTALTETRDGVRLALACGTELRARCVVIAAGAGSASLVNGLDLRSQIIPLVGMAERATGAASLASSRFPLADLPCTIDGLAGCYTRPGESAGFFYCGGAGLRDARPGVEIAPGLHALATENLSRLSRTRAVEGLAAIALYEGADAYTADYHPLLGFVHAQPRIALMTGFSGRGAKYIPAAAEAVSAEVRRKLGAPA